VRDGVALTSAVSLRPFVGGDRFPLNRWLSEAHVAAWFGTRAIAEAECSFAQSTASALVRVISADGAPIGYIHGYDAALTGGRRAAALGDGVYLLTVLIGAAAFRGKGYGAAAAAALRDEIFATTMAPAVALLAPLKHENAVRALEREGFRWREIWHDASLGPCWVLVSERARS
jgi:RimJ/RimL family protein N-acetyltransferase